jgi:hypothetical protein
VERPLVGLDRGLLDDDRRVARGALQSRPRREGLWLDAGEERPEDAVVGLEILPASDQRGPAGPVQLLRRQQRGRPAERLDPARADCDPLGAKRPAETDEQLRH